MNKCQADADTGAVSSSAAPLQSGVGERDYIKALNERDAYGAVVSWLMGWFNGPLDEIAPIEFVDFQAIMMNAGMMDDEYNLTETAKILYAGSQLEEASSSLADDASPRERSQPDTEILRSQLNEAVEIIRPFAAIEPSSLFSANGSEAEGYIVSLSGEARTDFTGHDLARARAFISKIDIGK